MSWQYGWGVHYRKEGKWKEKDFGFEEIKAREFFEKIKKYEGDAALFRYRPQTVADSFLQTRIHFGGRGATVAEILVIGALLAALITLWRVFPSI